MLTAAAAAAPPARSIPAPKMKAVATPLAVTGISSGASPGKGCLSTTMRREPLSSGKSGRERWRRAEEEEEEEEEEDDDDVEEEVEAGESSPPAPAAPAPAPAPLSTQPTGKQSLRPVAR
jgi:hypothetical protein